VTLGFSLLMSALPEHLVRLAVSLGLEVPPKPRLRAKRDDWHRDLARMVHGEIQRRRIADALGRTRAKGGWET
jgi:hypothetical protein